MVQEGNKRRQAVWQDVTPAKKRPDIAPKTKRSFSLPTLRVRVRIPSLNKAKAIARNSSKKQRIVAAIILGIIIAAFVSWYFLFARNHTTSKNTPATKITLAKGDPPYSTILPAGKSSSNLGGWTRVSPPNSNPVYAYIDKIGTSSITVSEQPLPADFAKDADAQVKQLAQSFNAGDKVSVGHTTVYIATADQGSQRVFFTKNNLLILITSNVIISNDTWAKYINTLQ